MVAVRTKRIYEAPEDGDGHRILVDGIWPRGVSKERAALDRWMPDVAPSSELRQWFGHEPEKWDEFQLRYRAELEASPDLDELAAIAATGPTTLLYSARDETHNQAVALAAVLDER